MKNKSLVHYITKYLIDVMFFGGIAACFCVPLIVKWISGVYLLRNMNIYTKQLTAALYISGICAVYILFNLKRMFKTLITGNPFVDKNVSCFRKMAAACAVVAATYLIKCILLFTPASAIIALVFAVGCLFCLTLKDLFKAAIEYKEENELTI